MVVHGHCCCPPLTTYGAINNMVGSWHCGSLLPILCLPGKRLIIETLFDKLKQGAVKMFQSLVQGSGHG